MSSKKSASVSKAANWFIQRIEVLGLFYYVIVIATTLYFSIYNRETEILIMTGSLVAFVASLAPSYLRRDD